MPPRAPSKLSVLPIALESKRPAGKETGRPHSLDHDSGGGSRSRPNKNPAWGTRGTILPDRKCMGWVCHSVNHLFENFYATTIRLHNIPAHDRLAGQPHGHRIEIAERMDAHPGALHRLRLLDPSVGHFLRAHAASAYCTHGRAALAPTDRKGSPQPRTAICP